jgi:hypothetical protein
MHAAQIYAEMLGLVCHEKLFSSHPNGYQEVSPSSKLALIPGICGPC